MIAKENIQPFVSVIIPNYNHARYLEQRLDSVLNQTYQNFEVFILDDHSTDNSLEVINRYKDNPHIKQIVVNETNSGNTFKQWDKGIHLATGDIIWIAESDDYCELNMLEELVKAYTSSHNSVIAYSTYIMVDGNGCPLSIPKKKYGIKKMHGDDFVTHCMITSNVITNASCAIFSKKAALNVRNEYQTFRGAGDYLFWVEIASQGGTVTSVDERLSYFRRSGNTVTDRNFTSGNAAIEDMRVLKYIESQYKLSWLHKRIAYANHARMFRNVDYDSEEMKQRAYALWKIPNQESYLDYFIMWFRGSMFRHFKLYI